MPDQLQLRGGTTTEHNSFTGALREVTVDTTKKTLVVHDGSQAGGTPLMKESGATAASSVQIGTGGVERLKLTSSEVVFNETSTDTDFRIEGNGEANLFKVDAGTDLIGIGTSSPSTRLHVEGSQDSLLFLKSTDAGSGLAAADNSGSSIIQNIGGSFRVLTGGDPNVVGTASTEKFRITGGGNVGIGTASPSTILHVKASNPDVYLENTGGGTGQLRIGHFTNGAFIGTYSDDGGGSDSLRLGTHSGDERMRISSDGKVGIGTSSPTSLLHVSSSESVALFDGNPSTSNVYVDINAAANRRGVIRFQSAGTNKWSIGRGDSDELSENNFHISTGSSGGDAAKLVVTSAGNVGIGTASPNSLLQLSALGASDEPTFKVSSENSTIFLRTAGSSGAFPTGGGGNDGELLYFGGDFRVGVGTASKNLIFFNGSGYTERMRIDSSGRLLLNKTTNRDQYYGGTLTGKLQVEGTDNTSRLTQFIHNQAAQNQHILVIGKSRGSSVGDYTLVQNGDYLGTLSFQGADGDAMIEGARIDVRVDGTAGDQNMPAKLTFATTKSGNSSTSQRMSIDDEGIISMGSENHSLGVSTTVGAGTNKYNYRGHHSGTVGNPASGTISFTVWSNGNVENTNNSYGQVSDETLKQDIVDASSQWNDIKNITVRKFRFKDNPTGELQIGVVAQEVEKVSAGLVYETGDVGEEVKAVKYSVLYMKAIKALQEAIAKIEVLETKVAALEAA